MGTLHLVRFPAVALTFPGLNLNMNPLILRLTGLWYGPHPKWNACKHVLYAIYTLWMISMLFGLMVVGGAAVYMYRDDIVSVASNTCLFVEDIGTFIKALLFVWRRGPLQRVIEHLDALSWDAVVVRGGAASRRIIAESGRRAMIFTTLFLSMGFITYVMWIVYPVVLGTGLDCWAALRAAESSVATLDPVNIAFPPYGEAINGGEGNGSKEHHTWLERSNGSSAIIRPSTAPLDCRPPVLPAVGYFVWDFYQNPGYAYAYLFLVVCVYYMYIITSIIDTLFISMMIYISALLRVLAADIVSLRTKLAKHSTLRTDEFQGSSLHEKFSAVEEATMESALSEDIDFHQNIIDCVNEMQDVISAPVLVQFIVSMTVMCMALFATAANTGGDHAATSKFAAYLLTLFSQLLLYCWFGDEVTSSNEEIVLAAYGSSWFNGSQEFKKRIFLIMLRAQRTMAFRGGVFYDLSRNTFLYLVNASYSFFNLLMQV